MFIRVEPVVLFRVCHCRKETGAVKSLGAFAILVSFQITFISLKEQLCLSAKLRPISGPSSSAAIDP